MFEEILEGYTSSRGCTRNNYNTSNYDNFSEQAVEHFCRKFEFSIENQMLDMIDRMNLLDSLTKLSSLYV